MNILLTVCILHQTLCCNIYTVNVDLKQIFEKKKEVIKVVLLDELKVRLSAYEEPLKDLRDSL
ncbi:hypothetical protein [Mediterraneibacter gnavus]|uniref:hypothetical protein n=1 Tax=Mediterraneibacter gnavus TaxID=33038 RepID=UPI0032B7648B